jgi:NAD(P)-dependent dehydrogenase (short-subunit alcohol dehydrogenase family)
MSFRSDLLAGRRILLAGTHGVADTELDQSLLRLGAWTRTFDAKLLADEEQAQEWVAASLPVHAVLIDSRPIFAPGGEEGLRQALELAWVAARTVAQGALIPDAAGGRILFLAPAPEGGPLAKAARAGLENLARTLSVEWARFGITAVTVCPGPDTTEGELSEVTAFLLSAAGGYFSGCRLDLGLVPHEPLIPAS